MEKLIELLNKHRVELAHGNLQNQLMRHYNGYVFGLGDLNSQNCILLIISKEYGFIQRLLNNQEIDQEKLDHSLGSCSYIKNDLAGSCIKLTMYLAIQDNPIEFLISILK